MELHAVFFNTIVPIVAKQILPYLGEGMGVSQVDQFILYLWCKN